MTNRATLEAMLARVLEGSGPDRELDGEIAVALFGGEIIWKTARYTMEQYPARRVQNSAYVGGYQNAGVLAYTASLDAALTLVPEGWHSLIGVRPDWPWVQMWEFPLPCRKVPTTNAPTIQRALIAACLKARMEGLGE